MSYNFKIALSYISCFVFRLCCIFFALIDQGGQVSFFLHGVNIPLFTVVILPRLADDTP